MLSTLESLYIRAISLNIYTLGVALNQSVNYDKSL